MMRDWEGIDFQKPATGIGTLVCSNVSMSTVGELRRRNGMSYLTNESGWAMHDFKLPVGSRYIIIVTTYGTVEALAVA